MPSKKNSSYKGRPDLKKTYNLAKRYLKFGTRSTEDLRTYLGARNIPDPEIKDVVGYFVHKGILDDRAVARLLAGQLERAGYPVGTIRQRLIDKGLKDHLIEETIAPIEKEGDESIARRLIKESSISHRPKLAKDKTGAKIYRKLRQRGFAEETIEKIALEFQETP